MINNFENFSWDYDPKDDPYAKRMKTPLDIDAVKGSEQTSYAEVIFFHQLEEALVGVVEHANGPPVACYSSAISIEILKQEHGLSKEDARFALAQLIDADLGPSAPCFLDTSIVEK
jgi:hypothetical protein|tara:strand:- start:4818 stop:5165 length:348 start_codon:yes stop_codon:yes gene_type:complete